MSSYIKDGQTHKGHIAGAPDGLYEPLNFLFRPALNDETAEMLEQTDKKPGKGGVLVINRFLAKKVLEWDLMDDGKPVPVNADNMNRLVRLQWLHLQNIVVGMRGSDPKDGVDADPVDLEADQKN
jgi:hypothetical protein